MMVSYVQGVGHSGWVLISVEFGAVSVCWTRRKDVLLRFVWSEDSKNGYGHGQHSPDTVATVNFVVDTDIANLVTLWCCGEDGRRLVLDERRQGETVRSLENWLGWW